MLIDCRAFEGHQIITSLRDSGLNENPSGIARGTTTFKRQKRQANSGLSFGLLRIQAVLKGEEKPMEASSSIVGKGIPADLKSSTAPEWLNDILLEVYPIIITAAPVTVRNRFAPIDSERLSKAHHLVTRLNEAVGCLKANPNVTGGRQGSSGRI